MMKEKRLKKEKRRSNKPMKNIIIISGLAGSGKTYVADKIKESLKNMFDVRFYGITQENYKEVIEANYKEDLLILEIHPPFDKLDLKDYNFLHVVISKDWTQYNKEISQEKIEFIDDFFVKNPDRDIWNKDIVKYNKARFDHIIHAELAGDFIVVDNCEEAQAAIEIFCERIRRKELFRFAHNNYEYMLYHSLEFNGIKYEGTAPTMKKFIGLKLEEFIGFHILCNRTCLDIGCNVGAISYLLNENHFDSVDGIDILEENIKCARWLKSKFFRNNKLTFYQRDFMDVPHAYDYTFALAVLHHIAKKHKFEDVIKKLSDITKIGTVIEINEMPNWNINKIEAELMKYFKQVKTIGNSYLPVSKTISKNRWIIHCKK